MKTEPFTDGADKMVNFWFSGQMYTVHYSTVCKKLKKQDKYRCILSRRDRIGKLRFRLQYSISQCCGAGAGGAEIILRPGAGAEIIFIIKYFPQSVWRM